MLGIDGTHNSTPRRSVHLYCGRVKVLTLVVDVRNEGGCDAGRDDSIGEQLGPKDAGQHGGRSVGRERVAAQDDVQRLD